MDFFTLHITLYEIISLGTLFAGLTLALLLVFAKRVDRTANLLLGLAVAVTVFKSGGITPLFLPVLGTLLYFYVRRFTNPSRQFNRRDVLHFCPLLVTFWMPAWLVLVSVVIYLYFSRCVIQDFYRRLQPVLMDRPRFAFRRQESALNLLGLTCTLSLFNGVFYFAIAFVLIGMAADEILKPGGSAGLVTPITDKSGARDKARRLKEAVAANRLYQDAELTLTTLALKLAVHPHDLSRIINTGLEKNFSDFINEFRVREISRKMKDPAYDKLTLLGIAYESGFNSKRTFNRVFKEMTGKTPVEYKNGLKKEGPINKLAPSSPTSSVILRSGSLPNWAAGKSNRNVMIKNYLKVAWRNLARSRVSSVINIGGLAIGMAVTILIGLWIFDEVSFNKYFKNYDSVAQVMMKQIDIDGWDTYKSVSIPLNTDLRNNFNDEFKAVVLSSGTMDHIVSFGEAKFTQLGNFMQPEAPDMFSLEMLKGNSHSALTDPHSIILSQSLSEKLFGSSDPMGKLLKIDNLYTATITGVYRDLPNNTQFNDVQFIAPFDLMRTVPAWNADRDVNWNNNGPVIYVQLNPGWSFENASAKIKYEKFNHIDKARQQRMKSEVFLQPMSNWHLYNRFDHGVSVISPQLQFVWLYGIIGAFVLLLACINFMNLSTARSEKRAKEVGIRKAIGSMRSQLVSQFYSESLLVALCAFAVSVILVLLALPWFNQVADKQISILWANPIFWLVCLAFTLFTGLIAGSYPALYLSSFNPVKVLKGTFKAGRLAAVPRKVLVVVQFTVSVTLIIGTIIVYRQVLFSKSRPVGYSKEGLVYINMQTDDIYRHFEAFRNDLLKTGAVTDAAESDGTINQLSSNNGGFSWKGKDPTVADKIYFGTIGVSPDFGKTAGWQFTDGRDFSSEMAAGDSDAYVINEAAVKYMGLKNPVGQIIQRDSKNFRIIGVIKDVLMESPYEPVSPTVFFLGPWNHATVNIRLNPRNTTAGALAKIEPIFKKYAPAMPFDYKFADADYAQKFTAEDRIGKLAGCFAGLAVLISCIGLFGLASFVAEQRTKEVGIRKVLGASVSNLWNMVSKDFVLLVLLSCFIAMPIAYYYLHQWLQQYQYRTEISWWIFAAAAGGAVIITMLTVSFQAIKAAVANPVRSLRSE